MRLGGRGALGKLLRLPKTMPTMDELLELTPALD
jgi:hypothetical protein